MTTTKEQTMEEVTQALSPCPFCGVDAHWVEDTGAFDVPFGLVSEHSTDCFMGPAIMNDRDTIIAAWNTRATIAQQGEELARMREALACIRNEAERENGRWVHLKRCIAVQARAALESPKP